MTPKEETKELMNKMHLFTSGDVGNGDLVGANAKQCVLICLKHTLKVLEEFPWQNHKQIKHQKRLKQEIYKL